MPQDPRGTKQANVPSLFADFSFSFWILVVLTGIAAGVGAIVMMAILRAVQHLSFQYHTGEFSTAVGHHSFVRRVIILAIGGLITGLGLWIMHKNKAGTGGEPTQVVWSRSGKLSFVRTLISGALSELTVGMGASLGRESAPQRFGAAAAAVFGRRFSLPLQQRAILIACGAGAGIGAVYNVPLAGAIFAIELYLGTISLPIVISAMATSSIATAIAWITLHDRPVYVVPLLPKPTLSLIVFGIVIGPIIGLVSAGYIKSIVWANDHKAKGFQLLILPFVIFTGLGVIAIKYPLLLGNGRDLAQFAFTKTNGLAIFAILGILKPLVTSACLRSGASGGLFTPTLSFGVIFGALLGHSWILMWPGSPPAAYVIIAGGAMLGAAMQAPVAGIAFIVGLSGNVDAVMVPIILAVVGATLVSRRLELRSIYSSRLSLSELEPLDKTIQ